METTFNFGFKYNYHVNSSLLFGFTLFRCVLFLDILRIYCMTNPQGLLKIHIFGLEIPFHEFY